MEQGEFSEKTKRNNWFSKFLGTLGNFSVLLDEMQRKNRANGVRAAFDNFVELANAAKAEELQVTLIDGDRIVSTNVESIKLDISFKY